MESGRLNFSVVVMVAAVVVAGVAAYFTYGQLQLSEDTAKRQLRAYVFAVPGNVYNVSLGREPEPRTIIRNAGETPARNVQRWIDIMISAPLSPEEEASLGCGVAEEGMLVLSPGGADDVIIRRGRTLEDGEADEDGDTDNIRAGLLRIYVFGCIEYEDVFGEPHWTEFCHIYSGEMDYFPDNNGAGFNSTQAQYCTEHNEIDNEERAPLPRRR